LVAGQGALTPGNGEIEPLDSLMVINAPNAGIGGEGEVELTPINASGPAGGAAGLDDLFALLAEDVADQPGWRRMAKNPEILCQALPFWPGIGEASPIIDA
jgi:hypothetical protein